MHGLELHTAIQYNLPITVVVFNNNSHGMCYARERLFMDASYTYNQFKPVDLASGMSAMFPGLPTLNASSTNALSAWIAAQNQTPGPCFASIDLSAEEIAPFLSFHKALAEKTQKVGVRSDVYQRKQIG